MILKKTVTKKEGLMANDSRSYCLIIRNGTMRLVAVEMVFITLIFFSTEDCYGT